MDSSSAVPILEVRDLATYLRTRSGTVKAVDGVSFSLMPGETLGIVGESGSGKSMMALSIMGLLPEPVGEVVRGEILFNGVDLLTKSRSEMQRIRGRAISMIPQDPMTSLDPMFTVGDQLMEVLRMPKAHETRPSDRKGRAVDLFRRVKIPSPELRLPSYPHQMSGGMRQRVVGAISIAGAPSVLIADEPTTSLDPTIQYQYLSLLKEIQRETGLSIIFITHDFGILAFMCDRAAVMYAGRIVEMGTVQELFDEPSHPYTDALMRSLPAIDADVEFLYSIEGQPPALDALPPGCRFAARCPLADERCRAEYPPYFVKSFDGGVGRHHIAACWRREETWHRTAAPSP